MPRGDLPRELTYIGSVDTNHPSPFCVAVAHLWQRYHGRTVRRGGTPRPMAVVLDTEASYDARVTYDDGSTMGRWRKIAQRASTR